MVRSAITVICRHKLATLVRLVLACALVLAPAALRAQTTVSVRNTTTGTVSETATPCTNRLARTFTVGNIGNVTAVQIGVMMTHTYRSDLVIALRAPNNTEIQLMSGVGGAADNLNVLFDNDAASAIGTHTANDTAGAGATVYQRTFRPATSLSGFSGGTAQGTWTLFICDRANADSGIFYQADLTVTAQPATPPADLSLTMSVSNPAPASGSTVSYVLTVANAGPNAASGVTVRDLLPSGVAFSSATGTGSYDSATGIWTVGTVNAGASASLTISAVVTGSPTTVTNSAEIRTSGSTDPDSVPNNGSTTEDDDDSATFTATARVAGIAPALTCPIGTAVLDWDAVTWTAGSTNNSYTVTNIGSVNLALTNQGTWLNNATFGGQSPVLQSVVTGGLSPAQRSLFQLVDLANQTQRATTTITLPSAVPGMQFTIFDVDYAAGQFADVVQVTGTLNGTPVTPTLTNGVSNYVVGNIAYGDGTSADTSANGNLTVTFSAPVDQVVISYGSHAMAPADPGQQAIALHDVTMCRPQANIAITKTSSPVSDPFNGTTNPKMIPGATVRYCLLVTNTGTAGANGVTVLDPLPTTLTYVPGTLKSGSTCATAATAEDDNAAGTDESDPVGASFATGVVTGALGTLGAAGSVALTFDVTVN